jgi:subtilisin family serine protease
MGEHKDSSDLESADTKVRTALEPIEWFPAVADGVIAVGGTDYNDLPVPDSGAGDHVWIGAPGEDILTVVNSDDFGSRSGTSFAAALVSAAVWLSLQADEDLTPAQIRRALGNSADSARVSPGSPTKPRKGPANGKWNDGVGCGRLDVRSFMMSVSPAAAALIDSSDEQITGSYASAERQVATLVSSEKPLDKPAGVVEPRKPGTDAGISNTETP